MYVRKIVFTCAYTLLKSNTDVVYDSFQHFSGNHCSYLFESDFSTRQMLRGRVVNTLFMRSQEKYRTPLSQVVSGLWDRFMNVIKP